jgi:hypothetical protein
VSENCRPYASVLSKLAISSHPKGNAPFFGSLWRKKIRVLRLILDNCPTHAPKQIKKWVRCMDLPFPVKIHWLLIHASRLDQVEIVLCYQFSGNRDIRHRRLPISVHKVLSRSFLIVVRFE